ncbi:hypothetical protein KP509_21G080800 [Ceratopteris richardii]|nr:hypothetical protein KP509_21G080800 [Ceratopteris richardii]KAH7316165.1 hypothetical protein KP509_21G080800 [Ceratopteris richardii]KAH7316166.1 hypothetical protein KP509_21G080800 [Ceratopteris richardii]KAH7316167.1 hypothetical protein KP509_21G080800 [Ceratopteris richardii]KAH7316168.1 hypothetical protein KP509_21G080800 [Ceratopteris richardii]
MDDRSIVKLETRLKIIFSHLNAASFSSLSPFGAPCSQTSTLQHKDDDYVVIPRNLKYSLRVTSREQYASMYMDSIREPDMFWNKLAKDFFWKKEYATSQPLCKFNFDARKSPIFVEWFRGGYTNVCYNALDRHVIAGRGGQPALLWEGNDLGQDSCSTYQDLLNYTCQISNFLLSKNVVKGDRVCIYMPMIPELPCGMLACARIGAIHSVVFAGFSAEALAGRILDCCPKVVITCSAFKRGNKLVDLMGIVDTALQLCLERENFSPETCLIYENPRVASNKDTLWKEGRDLRWQDVIPCMDKKAPVEWMEAEDPLFMLYTSGSTGKPKGVVHTVGGYMVYSAVTFKYIFDHQPGDVFWCTADCGWITGHTYVTYGPLLNCATCVIYEGIPTWPDAGRYWQIIDKFNVTAFHTAPTAIRTLESSGDEFVKKHSRKSLKLLGSVGEPINPKAWWWYFEVVGEKRCPIVDTWWQTETGATMISPLPWAWPLKPGSATLPFFGVQLALVDENGNEKHGPCEGFLCIKGPWPGIARTLYQNHERYEESYFKTFYGYYTTGDGCRRDDDGYYWITGRIDDVINVSGHRISTGEVESVLNAHPACAEAAVVGIPHKVKGQGIYAFVVLMKEASASEELRISFLQSVRKEIGSFAAPEIIHWVTGLPKTRSGKVMRRILRKIACGEFDNLGDLSSLADPSVIDDILNTKP